MCPDIMLFFCRYSATWLHLSLKFSMQAFRVFECRSVAGVAICMRDLSQTTNIMIF